MADPLNPAAWNRLSYVHNSPTTYVDPSGHCPLCFVAIGASLAAMGGAIHYTATHPGASFDRWEYLSTVWRWTKWGGVAGAVVAAAPGLAVEQFGVTGSELLMSGVATGLASVAVTGLAQGGYRSLTQIEDAFLSGFYSGYIVSWATVGVVSGLRVEKRLGKAAITGVVGFVYEGAINRELTLEEIGLNFVAYSLFGYFSPSLSTTGKRLGYRIFGEPMPTLGRIFVPGSGPYLSEYIARLMGYGISSFALAGLDPLMIEFYWQKGQKGGNGL